MKGRKPSPPQRLRELLSLAAFLLLLLSARSVLADHYHVPSGSMEPTLRVGDHLVVDKRAYGLRVPFSQAYLWEGDEPRRGDVVVVASPEDGEVLVKRLVAVPGDRVALRDGRLWLNGAPAPRADGPEGPGERLERGPYRLDLGQGGGPDLGPVRLPAGRYLLLGDHRGNSRDGRFFGLVPRAAILGRVLGVFVRDGALTWLPL